MKKTLKYFLYTLVLILAIATLLGHANFGNQYADTKSKSGFKTIKILDEEIRVFQKGNGKDVLFIHGTPGFIGDWKDLIDSLSIEFRVTAFDRPGHGFSTADKYNYHLEENAAIVEGLIQQLDLRSPLIVGHSYGGSTAAHLAAHHRLDSCQYIIIDSPLYEIDFAAIYRPITIPILGKGFAVLANATIAPSFIETGVKKAIVSLSDEDMAKVIEERKKIWLQPKVIFSRANESSNYTSDLQKISPLYNTISADITVVTGNNADITFKEDCTRFHKEVPNSKLVIFEKTGHYVQYDKFNELLGLLRQKLNPTKSFE